MAETMGVDLTSAISDGALSGENWRAAVERCAGCTEPESCIVYLADHADAKYESPPDYCANAGLMLRLSATEARCTCGEGA
jgi:hypothetical protein